MTENRLTQARSGLAAQLEGYAVQVLLGATEYGEQRGIDRQAFIVRVYESDEERLDALLDSTSPESAKSRLERAELGENFLDAVVTGASGYRQYQGPEGLQLGAEWTVTCRMEGK